MWEYIACKLLTPFRGQSMKWFENRCVCVCVCVFVLCASSSGDQEVVRRQTAFVSTLTFLNKCQEFSTVFYICTGTWTLIFITASVSVNISTWIRDFDVTSLVSCLQNSYTVLYRCYDIDVDRKKWCVYTNEIAL